MDADLDEETQLALALSISEVETSGRPVYPSAAAPNNHLKPPHKKTDAELARELQQKFDQEAAAAVPTAQPPYNNTNNSNKPNTPSNMSVDIGCCAGCHQPLAPHRTTTNSGGGGFFASLGAALTSGPTQTRYLTALFATGLYLLSLP